MYFFLLLNPLNGCLQLMLTFDKKFVKLFSANTYAEYGLIGLRALFLNASVENYFKAGYNLGCDIYLSFFFLHFQFFSTGRLLSFGSVHKL